MNMEWSEIPLLVVEQICFELKNDLLSLYHLSQTSLTNYQLASAVLVKFQCIEKTWYSSAKKMKILLESQKIPIVCDCPMNKKTLFKNMYYGVICRFHHHAANDDLFVLCAEFESLLNGSSVVVQYGTGRGDTNMLLPPFILRTTLKKIYILSSTQNEIVSMKDFTIALSHKNVSTKICNVEIMNDKFYNASMSLFESKQNKFFQMIYCLNKQRYIIFFYIDANTGTRALFLYDAKEHLEIENRNCEFISGVQELFFCVNHNFYFVQFNVQYQMYFVHQMNHAVLKENGKIVFIWKFVFSDLHWTNTRRDTIFCPIMNRYVSAQQKTKS